MQRADSLKKTLMLGKTEGSDRGWDVWMASLTQWTHVWTNSGRQGSLVCCSPWVTKSWTWLSDWMTNGVCVGVRVGGLRFTHPRLDTERGWRGQSSSLQMISGWMLFHHHFVFHSVCLLFTWLRAWESGKHDRDIWKEKEFSDIGVKEMWKETRDPIAHGQIQATLLTTQWPWLISSDTNLPFLWLFPQCPSIFPTTSFSGPESFPEMLCLRLAIFREPCTHTHYLKYAFDVQKSLNKENWHPKCVVNNLFIYYLLKNMHDIFWKSWNMRALVYEAIKPHLEGKGSLQGPYVSGMCYIWKQSTLGQCFRFQWA